MDGVYEAATPNHRPSDIAETIRIAEDEIQFAEAGAQAVEAHLQAYALPAVGPDLYANLRTEPDRLRAAGARWQALRDRIRDETGQ